MKPILLALPHARSAAQMKQVLAGASLPVYGSYASGAEVLAAASTLMQGVVICGGLHDLSPVQLARLLPAGFDLVELLSSGQIPAQGCSNLVSLRLPLNRMELLQTVRTLAGSCGVAFGAHGEQGRSSGEKELVAQAKARLMQELQISEPEAHRLLQRHSMAAGTRMADIARRVLSQGAQALRRGLA